jgi:hypothetical protein
MVIAGLLMIAAACLGLGLVMQSAVWLIASLIATAGAGFLLFKLRAVIAAPSRPSARARPGTVTPTDAATTTGRTAPAAIAERTEQRSTATISRADEVWVIDGRPRYHLGDCAIIKGQDAEPIPHSQATEDGFMACSLCQP